ncbi:MAG: redoxin domain-containing protein [Acidimicrobiia bacterium]|nr:redoxin domain-containing protein [Acidimicrobiia bacterium]MBV8986851.1 redoxin domain-containing protein [Acidimicrobiia bacterium]MBV9039861.1 redoxin domain-containing protein [Acidimicrobiia bacterium]
MEGQGFRDRTPQFEEANAVIVGISFDTPDKNKAFADNENFPYRLLSDVDHQVGEAYGTARPPDDDWAAVARRWTFLIDPDGVVRKVYDVKDFGGHPDEVLADLKQLAGQ